MHAETFSRSSFNRDAVSWATGRRNDSQLLRVYDYVRQSGCQLRDVDVVPTHGQA